jgi:PAS domain S-box-containing protein
MTQTQAPALRPGVSKVATLAGWALLAVGLTVLAGWLLNIPALQTFALESVGAKANSGLAMAVAGVALLRRKHHDLPVYAAVVTLIGGLTLAEYFWSVSFHIDEALVRDNSHYIWFAGRLSQYTSFGFVLLGLSLLPLNSPQWRVRELSRAFGLLTGMFGALALISHLYDVHMPDRISPQANVAVPTALGLLIGAIGVQYAHPKEGIVRLLHSGNAGGLTLRRLVPTGLVASVLLGYAVRDAQREYRWDLGFSLALVAAGVAVCLMTVIVLTAAGLEREDIRRMESEDRFRLAANSAPVKIWMAGTDKLCTYFNDRWLQFTGRTMDQELGDGWADGVHPDDLDRCMSTYVGSFDRRERFQMEYRMRRHDGEYRWLLDTGVPRFAEGEFAGYIGSCVDVTDRKMADEALVKLERRLIHAQEEESSRIARELHDDINQRIAMLTWELQAIWQEEPDPASKSSLDIKAVVEQLLRLGTDIQSISRRLHSSHLEYLGLASAAGSLCRDLRARHGVEIDFRCGELPDLAKDVSLSLYRVLQEALQNAIKHSGVRRFSVELGEDGGELRLTVSDLGVGFDPAKADKYRGLGLISMRERMRLVQGEFALESEPGGGTTVRCRVQAAGESAAEAQADEQANARANQVL